MDSTSSPDLPKATTSEAAMPDASSQSMMGTINQSNRPLPATGDCDEETNDQALSIIQALQLIQVIYLVFAGIIALLFAIHSIVAFAVLVVGFVCYFGLFWYNISSSARTRENAIALIIRSFSVAAVLAMFAQSPYYYSFPSASVGFIIYRSINVLLLLVVSVLDWRWHGLIS